MKFKSFSLPEFLEERKLVLSVVKYCGAHTMEESSPYQSHVSLTTYVPITTQIVSAMASQVFLYSLAFARTVFTGQFFNS